MTDNYLTEDITDIPLHEVVPLLTALDAWRSGSTIAATKMFQASWYDEKTHVAMNNHSGYVFLTNEDFQVAMIEDERLTLFLTCSECGREDLENEWEFSTKNFVNMNKCEGCNQIVKDLKESNQ